MNRLGFYNTAAAVEHYLGIRWPLAIWRAVLEQAITDAVEGPSELELLGGYDYPDKLAADIQQAARDWIADEANEPRRFVWVCEVLDLDPAAVRAAVKRRINE